jgi:hypothetical protein
MADNTSDTSKRMFDLNRPQGYAKDDYLFQWRVSNETIFNLISKNNGNQNTRDVVMAVLFSISLIAHDDLRRKEEMVFHQALDYIIDSDLTENKKADHIIRICAITMGNLTSYVDQFRGLAHTLKIGELYNFEKPYAQVKNAFGSPDKDTVIEL